MPRFICAVGLAFEAEAQSLIPGSGWSGPYWGVTGGGAWGDVKTGTKTSDLVWSGHLGYGLQVSALYFGAEVDGTWGGAKTGSYLSPLYNSTLTVDWTATARARVGLAAGGALMYVTGGFAWSEQTLGTYHLATPLSTTSKAIPGAVFGGGIEVKVLPFISARVEALHFDYSEQSREFSSAIPAGLSSGTWKGLGLDETVVRAGLSVRFN